MMSEIVPILNCLKKYFPKNFSTLLSIVGAMLCMSGPKTMLNISRWTNPCYKTITRFYERTIPWAQLNWVLLTHFSSCNVFILAADETVVKKSGTKSHGLDSFFSSTLQKTIKSLCFSGLSLIHPYKKRSYPLLLTQLVFTPEEKEQAKALKKHRRQAKGNKVGRPKGSSKIKTEKTIAPTFKLLKKQLEQVQALIKQSVLYFVGDAKYGNQTVIKICQDFGYEVISKLQYNSALRFKFDGAYSGRGRPKRYGGRVDYQSLPDAYLVYEEELKNKRTRIYHLSELVHAAFDCPLNVVIIQKTVANKTAQVILFSTDLGLAYQPLIDYYSARFQIEFNFRDAKQFWGLEDFMNIKENQIHNAANLAFFMVNVSTFLLSRFRCQKDHASSGIRDLIASHRAHKYYLEALNILRKFNPHLITPDTNENITVLGLIHS